MIFLWFQFILYIYIYYNTKYILGLNMFLVFQVSVNFGISSSSKLYINLVFHI